MSTKIESNDKKEIGFIDEATAPSTSKTTFVKSSQSKATEECREKEKKKFFQGKL